MVGTSQRDLMLQMAVSGLDGSGRPAAFQEEVRACSVFRLPDRSSLDRARERGESTIDICLSYGDAYDVRVAASSGIFGRIERTLEATDAGAAAAIISDTARNRQHRTLHVHASDEVWDALVELTGEQGAGDVMLHAGPPYGSDEINGTDGSGQHDSLHQSADAESGTVFLLLEPENLDTVGLETDLAFRVQGLQFGKTGYDCAGQIVLDGRRIGSLGKAHDLSISEAGQLASLKVRPSRLSYVVSRSGRPFVMVMADVAQTIRELIGRFDNHDIFEILRQ